MNKRASCCGADEVTGPDGITHKTTRDALDRVTRRTQIVPGGHDLITDYTLDPAGNILVETLTTSPNADAQNLQPATAGKPSNLQLSTLHTYDTAGRRLSTTAPTGATTTIEHDELNRTTTQTNPDGSVTITERHLDGRTKAIYGTATPTQTYTYGVNPDGSQWTQVTTGDTWQKSTTNLLGQSILQEQPGADGSLLVSESHYNGKGQLVRSESRWENAPLPHAPSSLLSSTHYEYNSLGQQIRTWQDINGNKQCVTATNKRMVVIDVFIFKCSTSQLSGLSAGAAG